MMLSSSLFTRGWRQATSISLSTLKLHDNIPSNQPKKSCRPAKSPIYNDLGCFNLHFPYYAVQLFRGQKIIRSFSTLSFQQNNIARSARSHFSTEEFCSNIMTKLPSDTLCKCPTHTSLSKQGSYSVDNSMTPSKYPLPNVNEFDHVLPKIDLTSEDNMSISRFKEFLQIPTLTSSCNNPEIISRVRTFFSREAEELGLKLTPVELTPGWIIFVLTWEGTNPTLPGILLNSHYDVVPVIEENWHWKPFDAIELPNGDIVARGTQDMKCVCIQYLEAVRRLKASGYQPTRTVYLAFQPDEEMGGAKGMAKWVDSEEFKKLNVGFALDEGIASTDDSVTVFYGERTVWWLGIKSIGPTGHGSRFIQNTSVEKLIRAINKFLAYRAEQEALLVSPHSQSQISSTTVDTKESEDSHPIGCKHSMAKKLGDVVTLNLTVLRAGVSPDNGTTFAYNVIPKESYAGFDVRIPPHVNLFEFETMLKSWLEDDMTLEFVVKSEVNNMTSMKEEENPYWGSFKRGCENAGVILDPQIFPAATDGRYLRNVAGLPVIGFSPIRNQPILLHDHDERLNKKSFVEGISIFQSVIKALTETK